MMFKILVLQTLYTLSDDQTEYPLNDRLWFMRFAGLALEDRVPDAKTIWLYREQLTRAGAIERLFARFDAALRDAGYLAMGGQIVDATVVEARRPRRTGNEKATVKSGGVPEAWSQAKRAQMNTDGRWTIKRGRQRPPGPASRRRASPPRSRCRCSATRTISGSTAGMASFAASRSPTPRHTMATSSAGCSTRTTPQARSGPIAPTARRPTVPCWRGAGWCHSSSGRSRPEADAAAPGSRQRRPGAGAGRRRARLRRPEVPPWPGHPLGRPRPRHHQARPCQPGHQHDPPRLVRHPRRTGLNPPGGRTGAPVPNTKIIDGHQTAPHAPILTSNHLHSPVLRGVRIRPSGCFTIWRPAQPRRVPRRLARPEQWTRPVRIAPACCEGGLPR